MKFPIKLSEKSKIQNSDDFITIGKAVKPFGVSGELKVAPLTDDVNRYFDLKEVWLFNEDKDVFVRDESYAIENVLLQKDFIRLKLQEIADFDSAEKLRNNLILIEEKKRVKLPENKFFYYEVIGCEVYEKDVLKGNVAAIENYGSDDLLIVDTGSKKVMIPWRSEFVIKIDTSGKRIEVQNFDEFIL